MIIINHTKVVTYRICKRILINMFYNKHLDFSLNFVISYFFLGGGGVLGTGWAGHNLLTTARWRSGICYESFHSFYGA